MWFQFPGWGLQSQSIKISEKVKNKLKFSSRFQIIGPSLLPVPHSLSRAKASLQWPASSLSTEPQGMEGEKTNEGKDFIVEFLAQLVCFPSFISRKVTHTSIRSSHTSEAPYKDVCVIYDAYKDVCGIYGAYKDVSGMYSV